MPVISKPLTAKSGIHLHTGHDLNCEAEPTKTTETVMSPVFPSSLLRIVVRNVSGQHAVNDESIE